MDTLVQDARSALRAVRRDRGLFAFAVLIVGLGVGASTAIFSVMSPLMIRPLPMGNAEELVWIANDMPELGMSGVTSRTSNLIDFREQATSFTGLTGYNAFFAQESYTLAGDGEPERLSGAGVAQNFLDVLGVPPMIGRNFIEEEGVWGGRPAVVLTHGFWTRRFGGEPGIVGTTITLNNTPTEVVGVLPRSFDFSSIFAPTTQVDFLLPFPISPETDNWGNTTSMVGRLRDGATVQTAQAELDRIIAGLEEAQPDRWGLAAVVSPLQEHVAGPFRSAFLLLAVAAAGVMLIVCVNLSNLLLAKSPNRLREMAVRSAMGATRTRLLRQLVIESLILSFAGSAVGVAIATVVTRFVAGASGISIPLLRGASVDGSALAFATALAVIAGLLAGVVPALQLSEGGAAEAIKAGGRGSSSGRRTTRLREGLVVAEVALACMLLVSGGLVLKSFQRVLDVELGFNPANAVAWEVNPTQNFQPWASEENLAEANAYFDEIVRRVEAVPGVEVAGLTDALPLGGNRSWSAVGEGIVYEDGSEPSIFPHLIDHRYIPAMGIPLVAGRNLTAGDTRDSENVVVINQTAAREIFQTEDALGRSLIMGEDWRVVGIVEDVRHQSLELDAGAEVYFPYTQHGDFGAMELVARTSLSATTVAPSIAAAVRGFDSAIPMRDFYTLDAVVDRSLSPRRFTMSLLTAFAAAALLLAALGIYGVLSYSVTERTPEIGIRMALGATAGHVRASVVRRTLLLAALGVLFGIVGALLLSGSLRALLYGVEPTDPLTFIGMAAVLLFVAAAAGFIPAMRASRTDPLTSLQAS